MDTFWHELAHHVVEVSGLGHPTWKPMDPEEAKKVEEYAKKHRDSTDIPNGWYEGYYVDLFF